MAYAHTVEGVTHRFPDLKTLLARISVSLGRCACRGGHALNPRGEFYTTDTIQERLALRNYLDELRGTGVRSGGPDAIDITDRKRFADRLDRFLARQGKDSPPKGG